MSSGQSAAPAEHMRVVFPANLPFTPVGRVAVSGLALRLGFDIGQVEQLRLAVDAATGVLCRGGIGSVEIDSEWTKDALTVSLTNMDIALAADDIASLASELGQLVKDPTVSDHHVVLRLGEVPT